MTDALSRGSGLVPGPELGPARPEDLSAIEAFLRSNDWDAKDLDRGTWFVARESDAILGVVRITDIDSGTRYLDDVLVTEERRGAGIGAELMLYVEAERDASFYLVCHDPRIAFYERLGFELIEETEAPESVRTHAYLTQDLPSTPHHVHHLMRR